MRSLAAFLFVGAQLVHGGLVLRKQNYAPVDVEQEQLLQEGPETFDNVADACDACNASHALKALPDATCSAFQPAEGSGPHSWHLFTTQASTKIAEKFNVCICVMNDQANHGKTSCRGL